MTFADFRTFRSSLIGCSQHNWMGCSQQSTQIGCSQHSAQIDCSGSAANTRIQVGCSQHTTCILATKCWLLSLNLVEPQILLDASLVAYKMCLDHLVLTSVQRLFRVRVSPAAAKVCHWQTVHIFLHWSNRLWHTKSNALDQTKKLQSVDSMTV